MIDPTSTQPLVSIITVSYNQPDVTAELLRSLEAIDYKNIEVYVVDNGSPNKRIDTITAQFPGVHFIQSEKNLGFAGGNNLAVQRCTGKYVLFINNDVEVAPDFLQPLVDCLEIQPKAGMVSPKIKFFYEKDMIQYAGAEKMNLYTGRGNFIGHQQPDQPQFSTTTLTAFIHGAAMLVSRELIEKTGLMHEKYFLYYEEFDWCARAQRDGFTLWYVGQSVVWHKESVSTGRNSPMKLYYLTRNRLYFMRRNCTLIQQLFFLSFFLLISVPKNTISYSFTLRFDYLKSFWEGLLWNLPKSSSSTL